MTGPGLDGLILEDSCGSRHNTVQVGRIGLKSEGKNFSVMFARVSHRGIPFLFLSLPGPTDLRKFRVCLVTKFLQPTILVVVFTMSSMWYRSFY